MIYDPSKIPGLHEAQEREQFVRDAAFFDVTESICGFEVTQMTLEQCVLLRSIRHPLLFAQVPTVLELSLFLWVLSPAWYNGKRSGVSRLLFLLRASFVVCFSFERVYQFALDYVAETFMDKPPTPQLQGDVSDYYSIACSYLAFFGREYHQRFADTLRMPMKAIFQFVNESKAASPSRIPLRNPSESIEAAYFANLNRN